MSTFSTILLGNLVGATLLAGLAWLVGRFCRRPALLHALWLLVLVELIAPPLVLVSLPWALPWVTPTQAESRPPRAEAREFVAPEGQAVIAENAIVTPTPESQQAGQGGWVSVPVILVSLWAMGSVCLLGSTLRRLWSFRRLLRVATLADDELHEKTAHIASRLGLSWSPEVWLIPGRVPPFVWKGIRSARMYLPAELVQQFDADELQSVLTHELAHLKRFDHWVRWLEILVLSVYWWNPVAWLARNRIRRHEEECCDAWVVEASSPRTYANAILTTVDFLSRQEQPLPALSSGLDKTHPLRDRLVRIMRGETPKQLSLLGSVGIAAILLCLPVVPTFAKPQLIETEEQVARQSPAMPIPEENQRETEPPAEALAFFAKGKPEFLMTGSKPTQQATPFPVTAARWSYRIETLPGHKQVIVRMIPEQRIGVLVTRRPPHVLSYLAVPRKNDKRTPAAIFVHRESPSGMSPHVIVAVPVNELPHFLRVAPKAAKVTFAPRTPVDSTPRAPRRIEP